MAYIHANLLSPREPSVNANASAALTNPFSLAVGAFDNLSSEVEPRRFNVSLGESGSCRTGIKGWL